MVDLSVKGKLRRKGNGSIWIETRKWRHSQKNHETQRRCNIGDVKPRKRWKNEDNKSMQNLHICGKLGHENKYTNAIVCTQIKFKLDGKVIGESESGGWWPHQNTSQWYYAKHNNDQTMDSMYSKKTIRPSQQGHLRPMHYALPCSGQVTALVAPHPRKHIFLRKNQKSWPKAVPYGTHVLVRGETFLGQGQGSLSGPFWESADSFQ